MTARDQSLPTNSAAADSSAAPPAMPAAAAPEGLVTHRALLIGGLGSLAIGLGGPYVDHVVHGSYMTLDFSTAGAIFLLFALAAVPQIALCRLWPRARFTPAEMVYATGEQILEYDPLPDVANANYGDYHRDDNRFGGRTRNRIYPKTENAIKDGTPDLDGGTV